MSELHYDVMLSGELLDGFNINEVIQNLARLLALTENAVSELFQQKHAIVLNGVGYEQAQLQQEKLQSAGAESYLIRTTTVGYGTGYKKRWFGPNAGC